MYLQLVCVVEVDTHGRDHPGVEQRRQDLLGDGVGDEVKVERVPSATHTHTHTHGWVFDMEIPHL